MTQYLPPNLLALFAPREPIPFLPPAAKLPHEKKTRGYSGVGHFLSNFEDPKDTPLPARYETREERYERKRRERAEKAAYKLEQGIALWDPSSNSNATSDPYKTLFIARINYDSTESKLRREFEAYGPIKKINLATDKVSGKPRGYAFIEFEHEREMHSAYKHADGKKIDGKRVLVDVERGRTVKGWLPRRLGGGLGGTRKGAPDENVRHSGRDDDRSVERDRYDRDSRKHSKERDRSEKRRSRSRDKEREKRRRSKSPKDRERDRDRGDRDRRSRYDNHRRSERSRSNRDPAFNEEQAGGDAERVVTERVVTERRRGETESRDKDFDSKVRKRRKSRSHSRERKRSHREYDGIRTDKSESIKSDIKDGADNGLYGDSDGYQNEPYPSGFGDNSNSSSFDQFAAQNYSQPTYVAYNTKEELYSP